MRASLKRNADPDQPSQARPARNATTIERADPQNDDSAFRILNRAKAFTAQIKAKEAELDFKVRQGEVLAAEEVEATWARVGTRVKDEVTALPTRVVNRLPDEWRREVFTILSEETRRALKSIHHEFCPPDRAAA